MVLSTSFNKNKIAKKCWAFKILVKNVLCLDIVPLKIIYFEKRIVGLFHGEVSRPDTDPAGRLFSLLRREIISLSENNKEGKVMRLAILGAIVPLPDPPSNLR